MMSEPHHRREFLRRLGRGTLTAFALAGAAAGPISCARNRGPLREALVALFDDPERAGTVGAAYLKQAPDEASIEALLAKLFGNEIPAARAQAASDPSALYERLRSQHEQDFDAGRVANVGGWILSLTEVRVCALTSLDDV